MTSSNSSSVDSATSRAGRTLVPSVDADLRLVPASDVVIDQGRMTATSPEPWLRFSSPAVFAGKRFVEITYRASLYDDPVRPVLRFVNRKGTLERILPAPVAGAGLWRGTVPAEVRDVLISPVARTGRFDFAVESVRFLSIRDMLGP